jgi:hypothetical protein
MIVIMILLMILSTGCVKTVEINNFCLWSNKIRLLGSEIDVLSEESLRQIDDFNEEYKQQCEV